MRSFFLLPPVRLTGLGASETVTFRPAGSARLAQETAGTSVLLAPGRYDALVKGEHPRGRTLTVDADTESVDLSADERPTLKLRFVESRQWQCRVEREAGGVAPSAMVMTVMGTPEIMSDVVTRETEGGGREFRLPGAGPWRIRVATDELETWLEQTRSVAADEMLELVVPSLSCTLHGTASDFQELGGFFHGTAGPRLRLAADLEDEPAWDVFQSSARRADQDAPEFEMGPLPAGRYHLHHHLSEKGGGGWRTIAGWGGLPVDLTVPESVDVGDLAAPALGDLLVTLEETGGRPLERATLSIVDPMWEKWNVFTKQRTTGVYADLPLPRPPEVRVENGEATLPHVRPGRLSFRLATDDGYEARFTRDVDPAAPLVVRLPLPEQTRLRRSRSGRGG